LAHTLYLSTRDAAVRLSIGASTLKKLRVTGGGPAFHRIGRRVVYSIEILDEWARRSTFESTSEYRRGADVKATHLVTSATTSDRVTGVDAKFHVTKGARP
jgi:Helix-turn-helix domain